MPSTITLTARARSTLVERHLADHGFTGYLDIETRAVGGHPYTTIARHRRAAPWTDHLRAWLKDTLRTLDGVAAVTAPNAQTVDLTWEAR